MIINKSKLFTVLAGLVVGSARCMDRENTAWRPMDARLAPGELLPHVAEALAGLIQRGQVSQEDMVNDMVTAVRTMPNNPYSELPNPQTTLAMGVDLSITQDTVILDLHLPSGRELKLSFPGLNIDGLNRTPNLGPEYRLAEMRMNSLSMQSMIAAYGLEEASMIFGAIIALHERLVSRQHYGISLIRT